MMILLPRFGLFSTFVFSNVLLGIYVAMFGFHLLAASYSSKIHACAEPLFRLHARVRLPLREQLKLNQYTAKFHTTARYGISYGNIRLISLNSFVEVTHAYRESRWSYLIVIFALPVPCFLLLVDALQLPVYCWILHFIKLSN